MLANLEYRTFDAVRDGRFRLERDGAGFEVRLEDVERHPLAETGPGHECFSLLFRLPEGVRVGQGTYRLEHESLGAVDLFLVPLSHHLVEAVINRVPTPGG